MGRSETTHIDGNMADYISVMGETDILMFPMHMFTSYTIPVARLLVVDDKSPSTFIFTAAALGG